MAVKKTDRWGAVEKGRVTGLGGSQSEQGFERAEEEVDVQCSPASAQFDGGSCSVRSALGVVPR